MKAIGIYQYQPTSAPDCFAEIELEKPQPTNRDLLVKVKAVSVNPVDCKVRKSVKDKLATPRILGWDAAGIVEQVGDRVSS